MTDRHEYTSAELLKIAGRRMHDDPDPEVRAMAASLVTQARDRDDRPADTKPPMPGRIDI